MPATYLFIPIDECHDPLVAIPAHAAYNYLVSRVNSIVLDMERTATEILNIVTEPPNPAPE